MPDIDPLAKTVSDPGLPDVTETLAEAERDSIESTPSLYRPAMTAATDLPGGRYELGERRGAGSTGSVYVAHDTDLHRTVAVKVLATAAGADRFTREARIAAGLEHPNIVPVYDLDRTTDGRLCFTMRLIEGRSLGDALREPRGATTAIEWIPILRKVCDALAYAHHKGILHQDVKPDNILLGRFGAVLLVDWGAASPVEDAKGGKGGMVGTPVYLAPEVARGEPATIRSDVYSLGATMFHVLFGRYPMWEDETKAFWLRKRSGGIDLPTPAERRRVPAALLAIVMGALDPDPAQRYGSVSELAADLDHFQAGLPVTVYHDPLSVHIARWHRRHARPFWSAVVVAAIAIAVALTTYGESLKERVSWGLPVMSDGFADDAAWRHDWTVTGGAFAVRDGHLVSTGEMGSFAYISSRLEGATAIEYDGTMQPEHPPCDISVSYSLTDPFLGDAKLQRYLLQVGANDNSYAQIIDPDGKQVASSPLLLVPGRPYHIRMEIDGELLRILVDGAVICEHRGVVPLSSGWIGLYAFYPGKVFDNLRIFTKGMPEKVSALAVGDQYCQDGAWEKAAAYYARVAAVHGDKPIGEEAIYRRGLALRRAGQLAQAEAAWSPISHGHWAGRIRMHGLEDLVARKAYAEIAIGIAALYPAADGDLRQRLEALWADAVKRISMPAEAAIYAEVEALMAVRDQYFPGHARGAAALALYTMGDYEGVVASYPDQVRTAGDSLLRLGRAEEILTRLADRRFQVGVAFADMGRIDDLRAMKPPMPWLVAYTEGEFGFDPSRFDPVQAAAQIDAAAGDAQERARNACRLGRIDDAFRLHQEGGTLPGLDLLSAYLFAGREDDLLARYPNWPGARADVAYAKAIAGFAAGQPVALPDIDPGPGWYGERELWLPHLVLRPFIAGLAGDQAAMAAGLERIAKQHRWHFAQQPWHAGEFLAGRIDEAAFLAQPRHGNAAVTLLLLTGIRAELAGDHAGAAAAYGAFLALPTHERCLNNGTRDPVAELFATWRAKVLAK